MLFYSSTQITLENPVSITTLFYARSASGIENWAESPVDSDVEINRGSLALDPVTGLLTLGVTAPSQDPELFFPVYLPSTDGGSTFGGLIELSAQALAAPSNLFDQNAAMAMDANNGHIWAVWEDSRGPSGRQIYASYSADGGDNWTRDIPVPLAPAPQGAAVRAGNPFVITAPDGSAWIAYNAVSISGEASGLYVVRTQPENAPLLEEDVRIIAESSEFSLIDFEGGLTSTGQPGILLSDRGTAFRRQQQRRRRSLRSE